MSICYYYSMKNITFTDNVADKHCLRVIIEQ